jgi:hypothetical protein
MEWLFGVKYKVWVINTTTKSEIYLWKNWKSILPSINELVNLSQHQAYLRTFQSIEFENRRLGFGRMKWNKENNIKWTTKFRTKEYEKKNLKFDNTEIWAPDWNYCYREGKQPEIFINVYHFPNIEKIQEGILIAIPNKIAKRNKELLENKLNQILAAIPHSNLSLISRRWMPNRKFPNRIEDMNPQELTKIVSQ